MGAITAAYLAASSHQSAEEAAAGLLERWAEIDKGRVVRRSCCARLRRPPPLGGNRPAQPVASVEVLAGLGDLGLRQAAAVAARPATTRAPRAHRALGVTEGEAMSTTTGDSAVQPPIVAARAPAEGSHEVRRRLRARHADLRISGAFVAGADDYFDQLGTLGHVISALLAILLWPLVLLGIDFHVR